MSEPQVPETIDSRVVEIRAKSILQKVADLKIRDDDSYRLMVDLLQENKRVIKEVEEFFDTSDIHKAWKKDVERKKTALSWFEETEQLGKDKIAAYSGPKVDGMSKTEIWDGEVENQDLVPREYLTPDLKKLRDVTRALKGETRIPGWKPFCKISVTIKA